MQMDGINGLHGWQWIFIIEAIPTLLLSIAAYFFLPDFPENSKCKFFVYTIKFCGENDAI